MILLHVEMNLNQNVFTVIISSRTGKTASRNSVISLSNASIILTPIKGG